MKYGPLLNVGQEKVDANFEIIHREIDYIEGDDSLEQVFILPLTDYTISHGLGKTPIGWRCTDKDTFGDFKRTSWSNTTITLQCDTEHTTAKFTVW